MLVTGSMLSLKKNKGRVATKEQACNRSSAVCQQNSTVHPEAILFLLVDACTRDLAQDGLVGSGC